MWRGRGKDMFYTKKRFGKSGKWFEHHNDHYTVVATMNLDQKAIIQVNTKKILVNVFTNLPLLRLQSPIDIREDLQDDSDDMFYYQFCQSNILDFFGFVLLSSFLHTCIIHFMSQTLN